MNKEIEELLNKIKQQVIIDEKLGKEIAKDFHETILNYEETKNLLSYIEQLEKENEKLKQWDKNKDTRNSRQRIANAILMKKIKQLENNRDKAIEYIMYPKFSGKQKKEVDVLLDLFNILKGDSDE